MVNPIEVSFKDPRVIGMVSMRLHGNMQVYKQEGKKNRKAFMRYIYAHSPGAIMVTPKVAGGIEIRIVHARSNHNFRNVDGLITSLTNVFIGVPYADCLPVMMAGRSGLRGRIVGVYHVDNKNTLKKMSVKGADAMDVPRRKLEVFIAPAICGNCYEFSAEDIHQFADYPRFIKPKFGTDKFLVDLIGINKFQLKEAGVPDKNIKIAGFCTYETKYLFSARRDRANPPKESGIAVIGIKKGTWRLLVPDR